MKSHLLFIFAAALGLARSPAVLAAAAHPAASSYVIAVGYNGVPRNADNDLSPLQYADDDAIAIAALVAEQGGRAILLAEPDVDSRRRFSTALPEARPPTLAALKGAIAELNRAITLDAQAGREASLLFYYSGHGRGGNGASLTLADGELTHEVLYREILPRIQAHVVHIIVDACHAESVVRPRDIVAATAVTDARDLSAHTLRETLAAFRHVGAVVAGSVAKQTHEWDELRGGVFTHEVLSALRGAADVNDDGVVEYSEMAAFLAAANRGVADARARPDAVVVAPAGLPHAALAAFGAATETSQLTGGGGSLGTMTVEDERGNRLAWFHAEPGQTVRLRLPAGRLLFVRGATSEAQVILDRSRVTAFTELSFHPIGVHARGALENALEHGLYDSPFGRAYYAGFVDANDTFAPIDLRAGGTVASGPTVGLTARDLTAGPAGPSRAPIVVWAASASLGVASAVFGVMALNAMSDYDAGTSERPITEARQRYATFGWLTVGTAAVAVTGAIVGYVLSRR